MLNRHLGIDLRKKPEDITEGSGDKTHFYSVFTTAPLTLLPDFEQEHGGDTFKET